MAAFLEAGSVVKRYRIGATEVPVLRGVSMQVERGEALAVVGASGAGKSTLLNVLGGLDRPTEGTVRLEGRDIYRLAPDRRARLRARRVGFVFQAFHLLPELSLIENVMLPAMTRWGGWGQAARDRARARELLERCGLGHRAEHRPDELSGGEQQRAALARALMNGPDLVLADEPTGNLDSLTGETVLANLFDLARDGRCTLVLVTHNHDLAARCDRTLTLADGRLED